MKLVESRTLNKAKLNKHENGLNNGLIRVERGHKSGLKIHLSVTSHIANPKNVSGEKYDLAQRSLKMPQKQPKLKFIIHAFRLSRGPSSGRHEMPPRDIGFHWNDLPLFGNLIWMLLRSLRGNFGFTRNE